LASLNFVLYDSNSIFLLFETYVGFKINSTIKFSTL
jgi:hypothetical protein